MYATGVSCRSRYCLVMSGNPVCLTEHCPRYVVAAEKALESTELVVFIPSSSPQ